MSGSCEEPVEPCGGSAAISFIISGVIQCWVGQQASFACKSSSFCILLLILFMFLFIFLSRFCCQPIVLITTQDLSFVSLTRGFGGRG